MARKINEKDMLYINAKNLRKKIDDEAFLVGKKFTTFLMQKEIHSGVIANAIAMYNRKTGNADNKEFGLIRKDTYYAICELCGCYYSDFIVTVEEKKEEEVVEEVKYSMEDLIKENNHLLRQNMECFAIMNETLVTMGKCLTYLMEKLDKEN